MIALFGCDECGFYGPLGPAETGCPRGCADQGGASATPFESTYEIHPCPTCGDALAVTDEHLDHRCARCGHRWTGREAKWSAVYLTDAELVEARKNAEASWHALVESRR